MAKESTLVPWTLVLGLCALAFVVCIAVGGTGPASLTTATIISVGVLVGELSRLRMRARR